LAKFRFLLEPASWSGGGPVPSVRVEQLQARVEEIEELSPSDLRRWVQIEDVPSPPPVNSGYPSGATLDQLIDYYRTKRLCFQRDFFLKRAERHEQLDRVTRHISPALFFASVLVVLIHFAIDSVWPHFLRTPLIVLAAALPTVAAGIRNLRMAY